MKKGFTLVEMIVTIIIFSFITIISLTLLQKLSLKTNVNNQNCYNLYNNSLIIKNIKRSFNFDKRIDYEINNEELYLTNGNHFLLLYKDKTIFDQQNYEAIMEDFTFIDNTLLQINFKTTYQNYSLTIRGDFHEIHSS